MLAHRLYRLQQIPREILFHDVPSSPRSQGLTHHLRRVMLRNEQNFEPGSPLLDQSAGFNTIHSWHRNIEYDDVRLQTADLFQGFDPIGGFTNYFPLGSPLQ